MSEQSAWMCGFREGKRGLAVLEFPDLEVTGHESPTARIAKPYLRHLMSHWSPKTGTGLYDRAV
jgi:hypothetical protein